MRLKNSMSFNKKQVIQDFATHPNDTGSSHVQIALLTERINMLTGHFKENSKDFSCKRGLLQAVAKRTNLLRYLKKTDAEQYKKVIERLGLRK